MAIVFLGVSFLIQAIFHGLGNPYFISKKYRDAEYFKEFQKGFVLPYCILGIGWIIWGLRYPTFLEQDSSYFVIGVIVIALIPFVLLNKNRRKFNI